MADVPAAARPSTIQGLLGAWSTLKADPLGLLLPTAGILLVQLAVLIVARRASLGLPWPWDGEERWLAFVQLVAALHLGRFVLATPLRGWLLAVGGRAIGVGAAPWRGLPALWVVEGTIACAQLAAWATLAVPGIALTVGLVGARAVTVGAVVLALSLVGGAVAAFVVRVLLAFAPYEVVLGRRGPLRALRDGWRRARGDRLAIAGSLLAGDSLATIGGLFCGAGALPGYPIGPLAVLHRWVAAREVT